MTIKRRDLLVVWRRPGFGRGDRGLVPLGSASAHEYEIGKLVVEHPLGARAADGDNKAYLYGFIHNRRRRAGDRLIGVKAEKFGKVEFHADARSDGQSTGHRDHAQADHHPRAGRRLCVAARHQETS